MSSIHSGGASALDAPSNVAKPDAPAVGYPRLADIMSKSPETQIFRSFSQLNILNILRLQAELHDLDRRLTKAQRLTEAQGFGPNINQSFSTMRSDNAGDDESQASLLEEIDRKLERYNTALLQLFQLRGFKAPRKQDMDSLLEYLRGITGVDFLRFPERDIWPNWNSEEYRERILEEYITTDPRASKRDYFSVLLEGTLVEIYADIRYRSQRNRGVAHIHVPKTRHLETISTSIAVALSSLLPGVSMLVLYHVNDMVLRIVLALISITMFSTLLKIFTAARTAEIYAATAGFAAVVVVFIGSDNLKKD